MDDDQERRGRPPLKQLRAGDRVAAPGHGDRRPAAPEADEPHPDPGDQPEDPPPLTACRSCGHDDVVPVLDLGRTPLANSLLTPEQLGRPEPTYPLAIAFCTGCSLVQLTHAIPPEAMFSDYLYLSSYSDTVADNAEDIVRRVLAERPLGPDHLAVEVASNDGYLLRHYVAAGVPVLGIDPAASIAAVAESRGVPTLVSYFGIDLARQLRDEGRRADVLHANNVMAHVPDINGFIAGIAHLLADDGVAILESPYLGDLVEHLEFDTIYHEHVFYYSLTAIDALLGRHGLEVQDCERIPIHGGTLRLFAGHAGARPTSPAVAELRAAEATAGMATLAYYTGFAARVGELAGQLRALLSSLKEEGARIAGYGAAAKGATLLNVAGVGTETLDFVVDRNPHKQGRYMPGVHIPVSAPERLLEERPEYLLLLAWNFAPEITRQQTEYQAGGGRFIVPAPRPQIVEQTTELAAAVRSAQQVGGEQGVGTGADDRERQA